MNSKSVWKGILPKTSACEKILVVDVSCDKKHKTWETKEALMVITVIQGIVNRDSSEKIYLINFPNEHFWEPSPTDAQQINTDGFFDVPISYAELDREKKYPALSFLMKKYCNRINGAVAIPKLSNKVCDGAIMSAVTVCGQKDLIPLSPEIDAYIKSEGYELDTVEDVTHFESNTEALEWTLENYFTEKTTRAFIGHHTYTAFGGGVDDQFPNLYDYYVANRAFVFCLNGNEGTEKEELCKILNPERYPLATPIIGLPVDEGIGLSSIEENGYYLIIANTQNLSCTSAFDISKEEILPPREPIAYEANGSDVFVAFYCTDGDSMAFTSLFHYDEMENRMKDKEIPVGWSFNPLMLDIYPSFVKWQWKKNPENFEMISDWNDQTWGDSLRKSSTEAWEKYCRLQKEYISFLGICTTNNFEGNESFIRNVSPILQIKGYMGERGGKSNFKTVDSTVSATMTGIPGGTDSASIVFNIRMAEQAYQANEPAFILACVGDGRADYGGGDVEYKVKEVIKRLTSLKNGKNYRFVLPKDLAVTFKKWADGRK